MIALIGQRFFGVTKTDEPAFSHADVLPTERKGNVRPVEDALFAQSA